MSDDCKRCHGHKRITVPVVDQYFGEQFEVIECPDCAPKEEDSGFLYVFAFVCVLGFVVWASI